MHKPRLNSWDFTIGYKTPRPVMQTSLNRGTKTCLDFYHGKTLGVMTVDDNFSAMFSPRKTGNISLLVGTVVRIVQQHKTEVYLVYIAMKTSNKIIISICDWPIKLLYQLSDIRACPRRVFDLWNAFRFCRSLQTSSHTQFHARIFRCKHFVLRL